MLDGKANVAGMTILVKMFTELLKTYMNLKCPLKKVDYVTILRKHSHENIQKKWLTFSLW